MRFSAGRHTGTFTSWQHFSHGEHPRLSGPASRRYFFAVEEDNTPLSVTVTPCDAPLEWKLSLQELPEEASGEGSGKQPLHARPKGRETHSPPGGRKDSRVRSEAGDSARRAWRREAGRPGGPRMIVVLEK